MTQTPRKPSAASKKLRKELPAYNEMWDTIQRLSGAGDAVAAIMGASYLDHALELLLKAKFIELHPDDESAMFSPMSGGILGSFVGKIRVAYALDLLGIKTYHDLLLIADIRNVFAHSLHQVNFENDLIKEDCYKLQSVAAAFELGTIEPKTDTAIARFLETVYVAYVFMKHNAVKLRNNTSEQGEPPQLIKDLW